MVPKIYYINLQHRIDRKDQFESEIEKIGFDKNRIERVDAVYTKGFGILGCGKSHIKALERFYSTGEPYAIICEDDFQFLQNKEYTQFLLEYPFKQKIVFDVIMLGGNVMKQQETQYFFLRKVLDAQTTSGYMISREFAPKLIDNLRESTNLLEDWYTQYKEKKHEYCLDIYWKLLQPSNNWFVYQPKLGIQREGFSDIEEKVTNYGV